MYRQPMRPSVGAVRGLLAQELSSPSNLCTRSFHVSVRKLEDSLPSSKPPPAYAPQAPRESRQARAQSVFQKLDNLQEGRSSSSPHGPYTMSGPRPQRPYPANGSPNPNARPPYTRKTPDSRLPQQKFGGPTGSVPPPGTMVRAPALLRIARTPIDGPEGGFKKGPNLRSRQGPRNEGRGVGWGREMGPKRRERKKDPKGAKDGKGEKGKGRKLRVGDELSAEDGLSDGMVQQLLRLQRKEWDKVQYEPEYTHGSQVATELIETGKKLFEGENPPGPKVWGRLERRIGIVGMHGA